MKFKAFENLEELWDQSEKIEDTHYIEKWTQFMKSQEKDNMSESLKNHLLIEEALDEF